MIINNDANTLVQSDVGASKAKIMESITSNCFSCRVEMDDDAVYRAKGNKIDCALINFLMDNDVEAHSAMKEVSSRICAIIPFSPFRMMATTVVIQEDEQSTVRVFTKGAPELLVPKCTSCFDENGELRELTEAQREALLRDVCVQQIAKEGDKPLAFAYKDIDIKDFAKL